LTLLYQIANVFFFVFHIGLIVFNLFGWMVKPWRKWNLITLGFTAFSWIVLGAFYGFGYCFLTDWHWQVRERLGYDNPFNSYIQFLIVKIFSVTVPEKWTDVVTAVLFFAALTMSITVNLRQWRKKRKFCYR
jgi:glucose uptake protein GlcU